MIDYCPFCHERRRVMFSSLRKYWQCTTCGMQVNVPLEPPPLRELSVVPETWDLLSNAVRSGEPPITQGDLSGKRKRKHK